MTLPPAHRYRTIDPNDAALVERLRVDAFPRSAGYNPRWALENLMGPNALWQTEALCQAMDLQAGMRVLDLGAGKAVSSIFLAEEFGVTVWAAELWTPPGENWQRVRAAGQEARVFPLRVDAHTLPFADGFFDAVVSLDAYHYFGTGDHYLPYCLRFVRPGGQIGFVSPGLREEWPDDAEVPTHLAAYWTPEHATFHSPEWWRRHWAKTNLVDVRAADLVPDGWAQWLTWHEVCRDYGYPWYEPEASALRADAGQNLGFVRVVARRKA